MKKYCLALDLKDDPNLIREYEVYHQKVWPEILASIHNSGIVAMEIYRTGPRLFMVVEALDSFSWSEKSKQDSSTSKVQEWEQLMWNYQQALPHAKPGEKWVLMDKIFESRSQ